jgi:hypothetical protein
MDEVKDKEAGVPVLVGLKSHGIPTGCPGNVGGIHRNDHGVVLRNLDQILISGFLTGLV